MMDNYTHDELIQRGLAEMAYERDLEAQTARADAAENEAAHLLMRIKVIDLERRELAAERDALAAEVARRKADAGAFQRMYAELYERACDLEEDNAALRAQLAAGEGWRALDEPWEGRNKVQFLITDGWFNDVGAPAWAGGPLIRLADAGRWVRYRPAPATETGKE